jgi:hypothetical protein
MRHVLDNLYIATETELQETSSATTASSGSQYIQIEATCLKSMRLVGLENIFDQINAICDNFGTICDVVICARNHSPYEIDTAFLCIGAFSILYRGQNSRSVHTSIVSCNILKEVSNSDSIKAKELGLIERENILYCCLQAFERGKDLGWFVNPDSQDEPILDIEELAHYANVANGSLYLAVPGEILFFPTPENLLQDQDWIDIEPRDGRPARLFSPTYYAALFHDFGVSCVVCLGRTDPAVAAAFKARGIETEDLGMAADGSSLLRGLDRLLSLSRAAPGTLAVHSGEGFEWPRYTATLAKAFMMSRLGFDEGSAGAWLGMTCPWML